jgi:hypothetical protein
MVPDQECVGEAPALHLQSPGEDSGVSEMGLEGRLDGTMAEERRGHQRKLTDSGMGGGHWDRVSIVGALVGLN